jgi:hypothetical protein
MTLPACQATTQQGSGIPRATLARLRDAPRAARRRIGLLEYELSRVTGDLARTLRTSLKGEPAIHGDLRDITAVTVVARTRDLFEVAYGSFRHFYPDVPVLVVNGLAGDECTVYVKSIKRTDPNLRLMEFRHNIGHGRGMHVALQHVSTPYAYVFDSDTRMNAPILKPMLQTVADLDDFYALGGVGAVDRRGISTRSPEAQPGISIPYVHPAVMLVNLRRYGDYRPFCEHGAPVLDAMIDLHDSGRSDLLVNFRVTDYVYHEWAGTRKVTKRYL